MKIDINKVRLTPPNYGFNFCVYGPPSLEIIEWAVHWGFEMIPSDNFTNIIINDEVKIKDIFNDLTQFQYVDGFSPNLNKKLHLGHFSNLVIANAFQKLSIGNKFISIFGDTLSGDTSKSNALENFNTFCDLFEYKVDDKFFASKMILKDVDILSDGENQYEGSKIFNLGGEKIVGVKSDGSTSYFYQDVALAQELNGNTLYLTGLEQDNHFRMLKIIFPQTKHIGLGLVTLNGKKMSSSEGNVIFMEDLINKLLVEFNNDIKLVYNIVAGQILKSAPSSNKSINLDLISNPKLSLGLYLSYTMAHIKSCGVSTVDIENYNDKSLEYSEINSRVSFSPNILFDSLVNHAKKINQLYDKNYIKGNPEMVELFSILISDLALGMKRLGLFSIDKV